MLKLTLRCHVEKPKFLFIACMKITDTVHFIISCYWSEKCYLVLLMLFSLSEAES